MQLQYYFESKSHTLYDNHYRIELWRKDWLGGAIEIENGASNPISISYPNQGSDYNVYYPIWGSSLSFTFLQQHNCRLEDIVTDDERSVRVDFYRNGSLDWTGWVVPDLCTDSANRKEWFVTIKATDALGNLKDVNILTDTIDITNIPSTIVNWTWTNQNLSSKFISSQKSILEIIKICVDKLDLNLEIEVVNDLFETSLLTDERVFEKILIDYLTYQSSNKSYTCYDTLFSLLSSLNAVIFQQFGKWKVSRINYLESRYLVKELYDKAGIFSKSESFDNQLNLTLHNSENNKTWFWKYESHDRILRNPYRYQNITYEYGEAVNIIPDSYYFKTDANVLPTSFKVKSETTVTKLLRVGLLPNIAVENNDHQHYNTNQPALILNILNTGLELPPISINSRYEYELSFNIKADEFYLYFEFLTNDITYYWNSTEDFWKTSYNRNTEARDIIHKFIGTTVSRSNERGGIDTVAVEGSYNVKFPKFPNSGKLKVVLHGGVLTTYVQTPRGNSVRIFKEVDYNDIRISSSNGLTKETHTFENIKKVSFHADDLTIYNGDGFQDFFARSNFTIKDSGYRTTKIWKDSTSQEPTNLLAFSARSIINNYSKRRTIIEGTLISKDKIKIGSLLNFDSYSKFKNKKLLVIPPLSYNACLDEYQVTLFELSCGTAEGLLTEYYLDSSSFPLYQNIKKYDAIICEGDEGIQEGKFFQFGTGQSNNLWVEVEGEGVLDNVQEGVFFEFGQTIGDLGWIEVEGEGTQDEDFTITHLYILEKLFITQ